MLKRNVLDKKGAIYKAKLHLRKVVKSERCHSIGQKRIIAQYICSYDDVIAKTARRSLVTNTLKINASKTDERHVSNDRNNHYTT